MYKYVKYISLFAVMFGAIILFVALNGMKSNTKVNGKMKVVASFYPLYYFATQIGGNKAEVANITPAGVEPHDYEPTASDFARISDSKLLLVNGGGMESWISKLKDAVNAGNTVTVIASESSVKSTDPHVWLDPRRARLVVQKITKGFIQSDPGNAGFYEQNSESLISSLDRLDQEYSIGLKECRQKDIITSHEAFGYLAKTYGLRQVSIAGLSPESEPSTKKMIQIAHFATERGVSYIFFESLMSPKLAQTIAEEAHVKTLILDPLEGLSEPDRKSGKDYFSVMRQNLTNLRLALSCR